jgi:hypothetical protein
MALPCQNTYSGIVEAIGGKANILLGNWQIREFSNNPKFPFFVLIKTLSRKQKYSIHILRNMFIFNGLSVEFAVLEDIT